MSTTITTQVEVYRDGEWHDFNDFIFPYYDHLSGDIKEYLNAPFLNQGYDVYAVLANVRNSTGLPTIDTCRGLPRKGDPDILKRHAFEGPSQSYPEHADNHSKTWYLASEFFSFDFSQEILSQNGNKEIVTQPMSSFLTSRFFEHIELLKKIGTPDEVRVVMSFCS